MIIYGEHTYICVIIYDKNIAIIFIIPRIIITNALRERFNDNSIPLPTNGGNIEADIPAPAINRVKTFG